MRLAELLTPCQILLDLKAGDRWGALVEMVDTLVERGRLAADLRDEMLHLLRSREDLFSTGIGRGVAIPHAFSERLDHVVAIFARSRQGIEFDSHDGCRVHFVVLFLTPKTDYAMHLHTLAAIAKLFSNSALCERLATVGSRSKMLRLLDTRPSRLPKPRACPVFP